MLRVGLIVLGVLPQFVVLFTPLLVSVPLHVHVEPNRRDPAYDERYERHDDEIDAPEVTSQLTTR